MNKPEWVLAGIVALLVATGVWGLFISRTTSKAGDTRPLFTNYMVHEDHSFDKQLELELANVYNLGYTYGVIDGMRLFEGMTISNGYIQLPNFNMKWLDLPEMVICARTNRVSIFPRDG